MSLPNLPLYLFNKQGLFAIGSLLGKPLTLDAATADLSWPNVARLCIEIDLLKNPPKDYGSTDNLWMAFGMM